MRQLAALGITLGLEVPIVVLLAWVLGWVRRDRVARLVAVAAAASLLTHPFAFHLIHGLRPWVPEFWFRAIPTELAVVVAEGLFYAWVFPMTRRRGLLLALLANASSFGAGYVLSPWTRLLGAP